MMAAWKPRASARSRPLVAAGGVVRVQLVVGVAIKKENKSSFVEKLFLYCFKGCVTMLMLVMPACLTASMTEAKAPKGTRWSARR